MASLSEIEITFAGAARHMSYHRADYIPGSRRSQQVVFTTQVVVETTATAPLVRGVRLRGDSRLRA